MSDLLKEDETCQFSDVPFYTLKSSFLHHLFPSLLLLIKLVPFSDPPTSLYQHSRRNQRKRSILRSHVRSNNMKESILFLLIKSHLNQYHF